MKWKIKARIMKFCSFFPFGESIYASLQKRFGRLYADPMSRLPIQVEMASWILKQDGKLEGKTFFEVGTGHIPIVPIGFFLMGASSVITLDVKRLLEEKLTRDSLLWFKENHTLIERLFGEIGYFPAFKERMELINKLWKYPYQFLKEAQIHYLAPADAAQTGLKAKSIDYHISITTLEHIPAKEIRQIFREAKRILREDGKALHFIDLSDHFEHQDKSITKINFLRYSEKDWLRLAGNKFAYCNRLRASDYLFLFQDLSFEPIRVETEQDEKSRLELESGFPLHASFKCYKSEDICCTKLKIMLKNTAKKEKG